MILSLSLSLSPPSLPPDPSAGVAASAGSVVVGSLHPQPQLMSVPPVSSYPHTQRYVRTWQE